MNVKVHNNLNRNSTITLPRTATPVQTTEEERPDLAAQLASATRLGHQLSAVDVRRPIHGNAPVHRTAQTNNVVQGTFKEALAGIDAAQFADLVRQPDYGLEPEEQARLIREFPNLAKPEAGLFYSIGQCVAHVFRNEGITIEKMTPFGKSKKFESIGPAKEKRVTEAVHAGLISGGAEAGRAFRSAGRAMITLYRADERSYAQLQAAQGMWGRDSGAVPASHARLLVSKLMAMSEEKQRDWVQNWKAQTKDKTQIVPFVATGKEAQKGGNVYKIEAPLQFVDVNTTLSIGTDTGDITTARVIAVKMRGDEVVFVTGIPIEFITPEPRGQP